MADATFQELITSLRCRVVAFQRGDLDAVRAEQALAEAGALLANAAQAVTEYVEVARALGWLHWSRYMAAGDSQGEGDLDAALRFFALLLRLYPREVPTPAREQLAHTGLDAKQWAEHGSWLPRGNGDKEVGEQVLGAASLTATLLAIPAGNPYRRHYLARVTASLLRRFDDTADAAHLDNAIELGRQATADDYRGVDFALEGLLLALQRRFMHKGTSGDLDEAIAVARRLTAVPHSDDQFTVERLDTLGMLLASRYRHKGDIADIDEAIDVCRQAVLALGDDRIDVDRLTALAMVLLERAKHSGSSDDLEQAIDLHRRAAAATAGDDSRHSDHMDDLGIALMIRFDQIGDISSLNEAIEVYRTLVQPDNPERVQHVPTLAVALAARWAHHGARADLDETIELARQALADMPSGSTEADRWRYYLAIFLTLRYGSAGSVSDLDSAVDLIRHPSEEAAADDRYLMSKAVLGVALWHRFGHTHSIADLDGAIEVLREGLEDTNAESAALTMCAFQLGTALLDRFDALRRTADLDEAIMLLQRVVNDTSADFPSNAGSFAMLGTVLYTRFELTKAGSDLREALGSWSQATALTQARAQDRIAAARSRAEAIAETAGAGHAFEAYQDAVALLPLLTSRGLERPDQQQLLQQHAASLARDATAAALAAGHPERAVELLEQGRAVLWSQMLHIRGDLRQLEHAAPDLAARLRDARTVLDQPIPNPLLGVVTGTTASKDRDGRMLAARQFEELVSKVRELPPSPQFPNPQEFLRPTPISALLPADDQQPVAVVNISRWRCDALILTSQGVHVVELTELTGLTSDDAERQAERYLGAWTEYETNTATAGSRAKLDAAITATLQWLWEKIAVPVLDNLACPRQPSSELPRLWWCPTGILTLLPLHAAGDHGRGEAVLNRVVSSYTPTLQALQHARRRSPTDAPPATLVVSIPHTPDAGTLPGAAAERDMLRATLEASRFSELYDAAATREQILTQLRHHQWLHAACHGQQNLDQPAEGGLIPYDWNTAGLVTVNDLVNPAFPGGELAFLSACKTATGGLRNVDEAVSVAAAMHYAGWRHVVGTLWSVADNAANTLTQITYRLLTHNGVPDPANAATALHHAVRALRQLYPTQPSLWASFIHIGP